jgi:hypothetical protein
MNGFFQEIMIWPERVTPKDVEQLLRETPINVFMECENDMWRIKQEQLGNRRLSIGHPELFGLPTRKRD